MANNGAKVPLILDHGRVEGKNYLLMERVRGQNLINDWYKFDDHQKDNFMTQIAEQLKIFHSIKSDKYFFEYDRFADGVARDFDFSKIKKQFLKSEYRQAVDVLENYYYSNISLADETQTPVLIHNDLHFENVYYEDDRITGIIDFDYTTFAAKDYELKKILDFAHTPSNYVEDSLSRRYEGMQLAKELSLLKKYYPGMFEGKHFFGRVKLYLIGELTWIIEGYQAGKWSDNAMRTICNKVDDWYKNEWLEKILT